MSRKKSNSTPFRFPFDIDSRVFLTLAAIFFILSIKSVNRILLPNTPPQSLASAIVDDYQKKVKQFNNLSARTQDFQKFFNGKLKNEEAKDLFKLPFTLFLIENDKQVFWNNTVVDFPPNNFTPSEPHFYQSNQASYLVLKQPLKSSQSNRFAVLFIKIKNNYPFKSDFFDNSFQANNKTHDDDISIQLSKPVNAELSEAVTINGKNLFYLEKGESFLGSLNDDGWHLFLHALAFIFFGVSIHTYFKVTVKRKGELLTFSLLLLTILLVRGMNYLFAFPDNFADERLFSPELFASSSINRSLGDVFINVALLFWVLVFFLINIQGRILSFKNFKWKWPYLLIWNAILVASTVMSSDLIFEIVNDSTINYDTSIFSRIDIYSFIGLLTFLIIFANIVLMVIIVHTYYKLLQTKPVVKYVFLLIGFLIFQFLMNHQHPLCYYLAFISIAIIMFMLDSKLFYNRFDFNSYNLLLWFILISLFGSILLTMLITEREQKNRENFANSLLFYTDKSLENKISELQNKVRDDQEIRSIFTQKNENTFRNFSNYFYDTYLNKDFSDYQHYYFLFDSTGNNLADGDTATLNEKMIEITKLNDFKFNNQWIHPYRNDNEQGFLFKIVIDSPQGTKAFVLCQIFSSSHLEDEEFNEIVQGTPHTYRVKEYDYSVGIYDHGKIISRKGLYAFQQKLNDAEEPGVKFTSNSGYSVMRYVPENHSGQVIIAKKETWLYLFTTLFAYIFFIYFATISLYILGNIIARSNLDYKRFINLLSLNLRLRVHVSILIVVFLSFIAVGYSTSYYLSSRTKDKLKTDVSNFGQLIQKELNFYIEKNNIQSLPEFKELLQQPELLNAISDIAYRFNVNINIFQNQSGKLIFSSSPDFFHYGLLSKQVNAKAYHMLNHSGLEHYIHNENIENFQYFSSYCFLKNRYGQNIGILQLPYISSNRIINSETGSILITLINIYVFVFLFSSILAFFITQRVTKQFTIIVKEFTKINLTKTNQPLKWTYNDEIGLLVKEYNRMLRKLENSSMIIAKNERDMAWREMAKQVAHEIKNPLTPMKLSLQMLERAIKNNNPNITEMTARVTTTLIEQIDNLTLIATNFSNFAKMPELNKENFNINEVLFTVTGIYNDDESNEFLFLIPEYPIYVLADKSQLIRVVTNLIQNAIQAIPSGRRGNIFLEVTKIKNNFVRITVSDNGEGIDPEKGKKLFQPYFTTKTSGTGLGLAMCKDIIEQFGGKIHYDSLENQGTDFYVDLPIADYKEV